MADHAVLRGVSATPVAELTASPVAHALTRSFEGYLGGSVEVDASAYERRVRGEDLDPFASRLYRRYGSPVGVSLVARRGWTSRVAGMGVVPEIVPEDLADSFFKKLGWARSLTKQLEMRLELPAWERRNWLTSTS